MSGPAPELKYVLLYVQDPPRSEAFYSRLLDLKAVESAPTFVLFVLPGGLKLGLWKRADVQPAAGAAGSSAELCFPLAGNAQVGQLHEVWSSSGIAITQAPTQMDFGYTFAALDPDGHRLRVFAAPR